MWGVQLQVVHVEIEAAIYSVFMVSLERLQMRCVRRVALEGMIQICCSWGPQKTCGRQAPTGCYWHRFVVCFSYGINIFITTYNLYSGVITSISVSPITVY